MNDRDLLEMAAKAAGIEGEYKTLRSARRDHFSQIRHFSREAFLSKGLVWDPLNDDGDAFRLALKLKINIEYVQEMDSVMCTLPGSMGATSVGAIGDVELRLAIVQAAAALGRSMS